MCYKRVNNVKSEAEKRDQATVNRLIIWVYIHQVLSQVLIIIDIITANIFGGLSLSMNRVEFFIVYWSHL